MFYYLTNHLKFWKLNLCKFVTFGSDSTSNMNFQGGVVTKNLK